MLKFFDTSLYWSPLLTKTQLWIRSLPNVTKCITKHLTLEDKFVNDQKLKFRATFLYSDSTLQSKKKTLNQWKLSTISGRNSKNCPNLGNFIFFESCNRQKLWLLMLLLSCNSNVSPLKTFIQLAFELNSMSVNIGSAKKNNLKKFHNVRKKFMRYRSNNERRDLMEYCRNGMQLEKIQSLQVKKGGTDKLLDVLPLLPSYVDTLKKNALLLMNALYKLNVHKLSQTKLWELLI